ncbi:MAG: site-specific integrase [Alphaproteobacteria bacterium]|nr:site-specific integrase [Alphaproteobacteria bacterium]
MADIRKRNGSKGTTWQVRYPDKAAKSGYAYRTFDTQKEAREFRESGETKIIATRSGGGHIVTVADGLHKWLEVCEKEGRDGREPVTAFTLKGYKYRAQIINQYPWNKTLHELTAPDVIEFRSWLLKHYPRSMAHFVLSSFHSMILEMVFRGVLLHDVAARVSIRERSRYEEPVTIPTEKEVMALLKAADKLANSKNLQTQRTWKRYRPLLYLAADSGMRPQEYLAVADASVKDKGVQVSRAIERSGKKLSAPKTAAGRRFIDLSGDVYKMVRFYADHHAEPNKHNLIFPTSSGRWQLPENWRNRGFATACMEAGLVVTEEVDGEKIEKPKYVPYDLRHFYASVLIASRRDLKTIQTLMGHEDIKTTLNVYGHLLKRTEVGASEGMLASLRAN